ncbi:DUF2252 domain-containing protein [Streptomyces sp. KM77-8]|uniref:DUF2252 domain-containing protein n=1 Tax=Streptomyces haneummycinicus TaxID=3074435 RepID=A0AAT9H8E7_9ACTN
MTEVVAQVPGTRETGGAAPARGLPRVPGFAGRPAEGSPKDEGKALRVSVPRAAHAAFDPDASRPDAVTAVEESSRGRLPELTPLRVGRMAATPFAFLRGSAGLMAYDLARTPVTRIGAQICGDAHAANFGLYGDARGGLVIDLNDFDETVHGPWEWDLKRLATSLVLAGREAGADEDTCRSAARDTAGAYRRTMRLLSKLSAQDAWNAIADEELVSHSDAHDLLGTLERVSEKARANTSGRFAARSTERTEDGGRRFVDAPRCCAGYPTPRPPRWPPRWRSTSARSRRTATRCWPGTRCTTWRSASSAPAAWAPARTSCCSSTTGASPGPPGEGGPPSALVPYLPAAGFDVPEAGHEGRRVVHGQKRMQVISDNLLGWTTVDGHPFQVRQFRNRKGSVDPAALAADQVDDYGRMTGALLARAHAHSADPV